MCDLIQRFKNVKPFLHKEKCAPSSPTPQELLALLQRRWHGEALEKEVLRQGRLRSSPLGTLWHVRDALGRGLVTRRVSTVGAVLRLANRP